MTNQWDESQCVACIHGDTYAYHVPAGRVYPSREAMLEESANWPVTDDTHRVWCMKLAKTFVPSFGCKFFTPR